MSASASYELVGSASGSGSGMLDTDTGSYHLAEKIAIVAILFICLLGVICGWYACMTDVLRNPGAAMHTAAFGSSWSLSSASTASSDERLHTLEQFAVVNCDCGGDEELRCSICLELLSAGQGQLVQIPCGHKFHRACLDQWQTKCLERRVNITCPVCRISA